jgi:two-component system sensor histidine kinase YesM
MKKIIQIFKNMPIQKKFLVSFSAAALVPVFLLGFYSNKVSTDIIIQETYDRSSDNLILIDHSLANLTENIEYLTTNLSLMLNSDLEDFNLDNRAADNELTIQNQLIKTFNKFVVSYPTLSSAVFASKAGSIYGKEFIPSTLQSDANYDTMLERILTSQGEMIWFDLQKRDYLNDINVDRDKYLISIGKKIYNLSDGTVLGSLIMNITEDEIASIYRDIQLGETGKYLIIDQNGMIISSQDKAELLTHLDAGVYQVLQGKEFGKEIKQINGIDYLIGFRTFQKLDWKIIGLVPVVELTGESARISIAIFVATLLCFLLALMVSVILSSVISKQIKGITAYTKHVATGDLSAQYEYHATDEIGQLSDGLNKMVRNTKRLIDDIYVQQQKEKELELKVLQSQINPHFLYNTLDSLYWLLKVNEQGQSAEFVLSLSKLFRYSISGDNGLASIREEIEQLDHYLTIQRLRFRDQIEFRKDVSPDVLEYCIPKLTLQPFIENAINHGLKNKENYGVIIVSAKQDGDYNVITIQDNGVGMTDEEIQKVFLKQIISSGTGLGINNVSERIELLMGLNNAVTITSEKGTGTKVEIRLPKQPKGCVNE